VLKSEVDVVETVEKATAELVGRGSSMMANEERKPRSS
jgi:hypothetical protein